MKRILLTLTCIISIIWIMPLFVKASVVAPDNNTYEFVYSTYNNDIKIYSNKKICGCSQFIWTSGGETRYQVIGYADNYNLTYAGTLQSLSGQAETQLVTKYPNTNYQFYTSDYIAYRSNNMYPSVNSNLYVTTTSFPGLQIFDTLEECYDYLTTPEIDFDNIYYDPTIPTPEFVVTMERPTPWQDVSTDTNFFDITWNEYAGYYVQIGYKFSYPNGMKVGLVDGQTTFTPLTYANSQYIDLWPLELMQDALYINSLVNGNSFELESAMIQDPESWQTSVPIWANNFNNSGYNKARNTWNTKMRYCWPLYGLKLEIFERLFYVADGVCYVGAWKHWNNSYPSDYQEEIPNNYQVGSSMPGYSNTSNNTEYQDLEFTETSIGTQTGTNSNPTVVVNNLTPNYPDYPTVATYNHDNILLQMIQTAKQLPQFFGDFSGFLEAAFVFIPSEIWTIIGFGFLCSIIVMIVKVL